MRRLDTELEDLVLMEPVIHGDERGFFMETFRASALSELGIDDEWLQDNHSRSRRGVVRGMHLQPGMAKLVRCARGTIFDVAVDARPGSPTYGAWEGHELSDANGRQLYVPDGFAHGFCVVSAEADVLYKCSTYYDPQAEAGFAYDDPQVGIRWPPALDLQASERDRRAPAFSELA